MIDKTLEEILSIQMDTLEILEEQRKTISKLLDHEILFGDIIIKQEEKIAELERKFERDDYD
jgi:hypothetical protein